MEQAECYTCPCRCNLVMHPEDLWNTAPLTSDQVIFRYEVQQIIWAIKVLWRKCLCEHQNPLSVSRCSTIFVTLQNRQLHKHPPHTATGRVCGDDKVGRGWISFFTIAIVFIPDTDTSATLCVYAANSLEERLSRNYPHLNICVPQLQVFFTLPSSVAIVNGYFFSLQTYTDDTSHKLVHFEHTQGCRPFCGPLKQAQLAFDGFKFPCRWNLPYKVVAQRVETFLHKLEGLRFDSSFPYSVCRCVLGQDTNPKLPLTAIPEEYECDRKSVEYVQMWLVL